MKNILYVVHTPTFLTELKILSEFFKAKNFAVSTFLLAYDKKYSRDFLRECDKKGDKCIDIDDTDYIEINLKEIISTAGLDSIKISFFLIISYLLGCKKNYLSELNGLIKTKKIVKNILYKESPAVIILGGDMPGYNTYIYIEEAKKIGIETFIVPSTMSNGQEQLEVYKGDLNYHVLKNKFLLKLFFKKWIKFYNNVPILRVPLSRLLALKSIGVDYDYPWIFNSSKAKKIFIESMAMKDYYLNAGLKAKNLIVTGSPCNDIIYEIINDNDRGEFLKKKYKINNEKKNILLALPPDFYYVNGGRPQSIFSNYEECLNYFKKIILNSKGIKWYMTLHPSMNVSDYLIFEKMGVAILSDPAYKIMPFIDIYIASVSSTIRWAIACNIPVLNFDLYNYKYDDFTDVKSVLYADSEVSFEKLLNNLVSDERHYEAVKKSQIADAKRWGMIDHKSCERIYHEIFEN